MMILPASKDAVSPSFLVHTPVRILQPRWAGFILKPRDTHKNQRCKVRMEIKPVIPDLQNVMVMLVTVAFFVQFIGRGVTNYFPTTVMNST